MLRLIVDEDFIHVMHREGGIVRSFPSRLAIRDRAGEPKVVVAAGDDGMQRRDTWDEHVTVSNPFDGDATAAELVAALLKHVIEVSFREAFWRVLFGPPRIELIVQRPMTSSLRNALLTGELAGEGLNFVIDGQEVPRLARLRTRKDLALLIYRTVIIVGVASWMWKHPNRWAIIGFLSFGQLAVIAEYARLRPTRIQV